MANAADIIVNLVAKTGRFQRGMTKGGKKLTNFQVQVKKTALAVGKLAKRFGLLAAAAGLTAFLAITKKAIEVNDELGKFATRLGIASDELRVLQIAADLSGQKINALTVGLQRMVRRVAEAAIGIGEAKDAIVDLGLDAKELSLLAPDEAFRALAVAMETIPTQGERIRLAFKLLDTEGVGLVNTMKLLQSEGFAEVEQSARDMNAVLTDFDTAQFEAAQDEISLIALAFEGLTNTLVIDTLPALGLMSGFVQQVAKDANEVTIETDTWVFNLVRSVGAIVAIVKGFAQVLRALNIVSNALITFFLLPLAKIEEGWNRIANIVPGITIDAENVGLNALIKSLDATREEQLRLLNEFGGLTGEMDKFVQKWLDAKEAAKENALVIAQQRAELAKTNAEFLAFADAEKVRIAAEKKAAEERIVRQKELNAIVSSGQLKSLGIAKQIAVLNAALVSGDLIANEQERIKILERRRELVGELIEAQQQEQGIETAADRAKLLVEILKKGQKETVRVAKQIASINTAIIKGEGDRNAQFAARKILIEELIELQKEEQVEVGRLTEIGLQTLRNMQDALASFFATTSGGFRGLVSGFTDMLRKMVAQLLARRILLSFLGLFARGSGGLAAFAQKAIAGLQGGGPLAAGKMALVGEKEREVFVPKNVLTFPTISSLPRAVAEDVDMRHAEGTLATDQISMIGKAGAELFTPKVSGTVVPADLFSSDVLADIERRQAGGPLAAGQASLVGEAGPELFIPKTAGQVIPSGGFGNIVVTINQRNSFAGSGPLEPATLIPLLEENNRKLKAEFVDELRRGTFA